MNNMEIREIYNKFLSSTGICIDTRTVSDGNLFIALTGDNFNANKFAEEALLKGCKFAIIDDKDYYLDNRFILVDNSLKTLQELAMLHRSEFNIPVVAITGTNGKTTSKELINSVLKEKYNVTATAGNFNNHIGLPLTLLSINDNTDIALVEIGANHPGEIMDLCEIARPDHGLITNIGQAHLEGFGSLENIIKTKKELFDFLIENNGTLFVNLDNLHIKNMYPDKSDYSFGMNTAANIQGRILKSDPFLVIEWTKEPENIQIHSRLVGSYNLENLLATICVGKFFNVDDKVIKHGIESFIPDNNRSQFVESENNSIILDAYNANPSSMKAALMNFISFRAEKKILILGDMLELGEVSDLEHINIIDFLTDQKFEHVILVGEIFSGQNLPENFISFSNTDDLIKHLEFNPPNSAAILVKGSRKIGLEKVIPFL